HFEALNKFSFCKPLDSGVVRSEVGSAKDAAIRKTELSSSTSDRTDETSFLKPGMAIATGSRGKHVFSMGLNIRDRWSSPETGFLRHGPHDKIERKIHFRFGMVRLYGFEGS